MEWIDNPLVLYGKEFPISERNFIFPFYISWISNVENNKVSYLSGEVLKFSSITGDGYGALATSRQIQIFSPDTLPSLNLGSGSLQLFFIVGFKVANVSLSIFRDTLFNNYLVEPKFDVIITYL